MHHALTRACEHTCAQDDKLPLARDLLVQLANETRVIPREYIQQRQRQRKQQQAQEGAAGARPPASSSSSGSPSKVPSKINEGSLMEVLHACARWPNAVEAKGVATQVWVWVWV